MMFPVISILLHGAWILFFETSFAVHTNFTYSNASNSQLLYYQGLLR